jgi:hypothetical protein
MYYETRRPGLTTGALSGMWRLGRMYGA